MGTAGAGPLRPGVGGVGAGSGLARGESGAQRGFETVLRLRGFLVCDVRGSGYAGPAAESGHELRLLAVYRFLFLLFFLLNNFN